MPSLTIDGREFNIDDLSDAAKTHLANIQLVDQKISSLQQEIAIVRTARNAYSAALQAELPKASWHFVDLYLIIHRVA